MSVLNTPLQHITAFHQASDARQHALGAQAAPGASSQSTNQFDSLNSQAFMRLLITELQHQDPTNPASEQQLASEMAQFSMATGINTLNSNVESLMQSQPVKSLAKATALIGKQVTTTGDALVSDGSGKASGAFYLTGPARDATVTVSGADGKTLATLHLKNLGGGIHTFSWKGSAPNTAYRFSVAATGADGARIGATPESLYTVSGVEQSGGGVNLLLAGNPDPLPIGKIIQVL